LIVVSDASPILNLSAVGKLGLLRNLYSQIVVPPAVQRELSRNGIDLDASWMRVVAAQDQNEFAALRELLDPGEAEAIVVAVEAAAGLVLIDEKRGRRVAIERGLEVTGLLGVLAEAKAPGPLSQVPANSSLDDMMHVAGFWIGDDLRARYLRNLNELD
jgi:predicted nucleic acid-binding protein